jgi:uncharacterized membrane protein
MQSHNNINSNEIVIKTVLILLAVGLNGIELLLPRIPFFPWFKPGFANIITIIWIVRYGTIDAVLFTILRSWISGFYFGFSLIAMVLSLSGGIVATFAVGLGWNLLGRKGVLGTVGLATLGACVHNAGQLTVVYFLFMRNDSIFYQIPLMMMASLVFGGITGLLVPLVKTAIESRDFNFRMKISTQDNGISRLQAITSMVILLSCFSLFFIEKIPVAIIAALILSIIAFLVEQQRFRIFLHPLKYKYFFLLIFLTYILFTGGKRIQYVPFCTVEGFQSAIIQMVRLWAWIQAGIILNRLKCNELLFLLLGKFFPENKMTLAGGLAALVYFPELLAGKAKKSTNFIEMIKHPVNSFRNYLSELFIKIEQTIS